MRRRTVISSAVVALAVPSAGSSTGHASGPPKRAAGSGREIGPLLFDTTILGGAFGPGPARGHRAYTVASAEVGVFFVLDAASGDQLAQFELPGAGGSWGLTVAPDGSVYAGTWPNAKLLRYVPGAGEIEDLDQPPGFEGEPFAIWRVVTDPDGNVYGGTSGDTPADGRVFCYEPDTGTYTDYGIAVPGDGTVRSIAYGRGRSYAGTGPNLHLVEIDPEWVMQTSSEARPRPGGYPRGVEPSRTLHPVNGLKPGRSAGVPERPRLLHNPLLNKPPRPGRTGRSNCRPVRATRTLPTSTSTTSRSTARPTRSTCCSRGPSPPRRCTCATSPHKPGSTSCPACAGSTSPRRCEGAGSGWSTMTS